VNEGNERFELLLSIQNGVSLDKILLLLLAFFGFLPSSSFDGGVLLCVDSVESQESENTVEETVKIRR